MRERKNKRGRGGERERKEEGEFFFCWNSYKGSFEFFFPVNERKLFNNLIFFPTQ